MEASRHRGISPYEPAYGFSRAIRVGNIVHVAGTAPVPPPGSAVAADAGAQMQRCVDIAREALEALGSSIEDVVRTRMFIVDPADADDIGRVHGEAFGASAPAATMVVVSALLDPAWKVEIEVEAIVR
ncbi:MAG: RidA family protein [Acidimicrobiia bacterium]|nr:RidA family protein [Acidimicrobiia bacterium]